MDDLVAAQQQVDLAKLPLWFGEPSRDTFLAEQWVSRVQNARDAADWNDQKTLSIFYNAMRGEALLWFEGLTRNGVNKNVWNDVKKEFLEAYSYTRSSRTAALDRQHDGGAIPLTSHQDD